VQVTVNGEARSLPEDCDVPALLAGLGLGLGYVVVERNGTALTRSEAALTALAEGDVVELVRAVAGG